MGLAVKVGAAAWKNTFRINLAFTYEIVRRLPDLFQVHITFAVEEEPPEVRNLNQ